MALFLVQHKHSAEHCPAKQPEMASMLLQLVSNANASKHGITIQGDAVVDGSHHLVLVLDGPDESTIRSYFAPFGQAGSLDIVPASHCETVVARQGC